MFEGRARLAGADLALVDEETVTQELDMYADFGADHPTFHFHEGGLFQQADVPRS
jgi:hypothetical protein